MTRRVLIALTVPDDLDLHGVAMLATEVGHDPTVWEWTEFFKDQRDGLVDPEFDRTESI